MRKMEAESVRDAVRRVRAGDVEAYEVVYRLTDGPLRSFIGSRPGCSEKSFVEEVAIRTHEFVWMHLDRYDSDRGASFQTWMNWQARNVIRRVRGEWYSTQCFCSIERKHEDWAFAESDPAAEQARARHDEVLHEELDRLEDLDRRCLVARDSEGLTLAAAVEKLGVSPKTVRWRVAKSRRVLRARLERRGVRPDWVDTTPVPIWGEPMIAGSEAEWGVPVVCGNVPATTAAPGDGREELADQV